MLFSLQFCRIISRAGVRRNKFLFRENYLNNPQFSDPFSHLMPCWYFSSTLNCPSYIKVSVSGNSCVSCDIHNSSGAMCLFSMITGFHLGPSGLTPAGRSHLPSSLFVIFQVEFSWRIICFGHSSMVSEREVERLWWSLRLAPHITTPREKICHSIDC